MEDTEPLPPGTRVVLHGLCSRPDLNGRRGIICAFLKEKGRYNVAFDGVDGKISVKPANFSIDPVEIDDGGGGGSSSDGDDAVVQQDLEIPAKLISFLAFVCSWVENAARWRRVTVDGVMARWAEMMASRIPGPPIQLEFLKWGQDAKEEWTVAFVRWQRATCADTYIVSVRPQRSMQKRAASAGWEEKYHGGGGSMSTGGLLGEARCHL